MSGAGVVAEVAGPVVVAVGLAGCRLHDVVRVGHLRLVGEVVRREGERAVLQVHEDTAGLTVGEPVVPTGGPLAVELGPGLLGSIYDGLQRPLHAWPGEGPGLGRGVELPGLDRARVWTFQPAVAAGERVGPGDVLGAVQETRAVRHLLLVPPGEGGVVSRVRSGPARVDEPVVWLGERGLPLLARWPVRTPRPVARRLPPTVPLVTGQRVIDLLFPLAKGGAATIPGGFGTGKTVQEQALARWAEADVVVYVACGERGNELTEVLEAFEGATDPRSGAPLMERTVIIANTSNMPIAAREASIYAGMTIAEYYRDQGLDVAIMADSTSRWGEALREVSGRLGEMPGEEGYPAYLGARLAGFYERAGAAVCAGREARPGSVTLVAAVSPPGGDLSEPITQHSLRLAGTFWALDTDLARRRHFPAIHWTRSYSLYELGPWFASHVAPDWEEQRAWALALLQEEAELEEIVQLLGPDALAPAQRLVLHTGRALRERLLRQSAFDPRDAFCAPRKQYWMLRALRTAHLSGAAALERGRSLDEVAARPALAELATMRDWSADDAAARGAALCRRLEAEVGEEAA